MFLAAVGDIGMDFGTADDVGNGVECDNCKQIFTTILDLNEHKTFCLLGHNEEHKRRAEVSCLKLKIISK